MNMVLIGDIHLNYHNKKYIYKSLEYIYKNHDADLFVLLGDIYHSFNLETLNYLKMTHELEKVITKNTIIIAGNHDVYSNDINSLKCLKSNKHICVVDKEPLILHNINSHTIVFMPYIYGESKKIITEKLLKNIKRYNRVILLTHYYYTDLDFMLQTCPNIKQIYSGDIHTGGELLKCKYVSSLINTDFNTSNRLFTEYIILNVDKKGINEKFYKNIYTPVYLNYKNIDIETFKNYSFDNKKDVINFLINFYPGDKNDLENALRYIELGDLNLKINLLTKKTEKITSINEVYAKVFKMMQYLQRVVVGFDEEKDVGTITDNNNADVFNMNYKKNITEKIDNFIRSYYPDVNEKNLVMECFNSLKGE